MAQRSRASAAITSTSCARYIECAVPDHADVVAREIEQGLAVSSWFDAPSGVLETRRSRRSSDRRKSELLVENPAAFDNTAGLYLALGNQAKALDYVQLCKGHRYENFAAMPSMPEYASLEGDPDFVKLFRR